MTTNQDAIEAGARALLFREIMSDDGLSLGEMPRIAYDAMAPIIANQAKAEALREAASAVDDDQYDALDPYVAEWLRARAATIEGGQP